MELQEGPGTQGGLTFECKSDCALASPCPVPLGQLVMSVRESGYLLHSLGAYLGF